ncbi:MAG: arginase family protein, partial [Chloroflexales bacterium]|nr:arginase family protein [Chloroflexales bacterium]
RLGGQIAAHVAAALAAGQTPLVVGGDCSHSVGVLGGLQQAFGADARIGLVWFDAHGDFNTPHTTLSNMLGGMPVAVCAGLAHPQWRELAGVRAALPTDRILFVDVRNLDAPEEQLLRATAATVAAVAPGFPGADLAPAVAALAAHCDVLYLHIDSDVLDAALVPNHGTREPNGPDGAQVAQAIDVVLATGAVAACAVVSVYGAGPGSAVSVASGKAMIRAALEGWARYGAGAFSTQHSASLATGTP